MRYGHWLEELRAYAGENAGQISEIVSAFRAAGGEESDLDDLVHDVAAEIATRDANSLADEDPGIEEAYADGEEAGSSVNNSGLEMQVAALLQGFGPQEARRLALEQASSPAP